MAVPASPVSAALPSRPSVIRGKKKCDTECRASLVTLRPLCVAGGPRL
jgi:hypothetical protein